MVVFLQLSFFLQVPSPTELASQPQQVAKNKNKVRGRSERASALLTSAHTARAAQQQQQTARHSTGRERSGQTPPEKYCTLLLPDTMRHLCCSGGEALQTIVGEPVTGGLAISSGRADPVSQASQGNALEELDMASNG